MDRILQDIRSFVNSQVWEGFSSVHEIVEDAEHYAFETFGCEHLDREIQHIVAESLIAHQIEQDIWESSTDCDRLDEAFSSLNSQGIVARQNFSCCNNCGFTEIWDEVAREEEHQAIEGYVFYHLQFTELAIKTKQLLLAYGCIEENEAALRGVVDKIIAELRRVGLDAKWQGTTAHPIVVDGIVWRKRR